MKSTQCYILILFVILAVYNKSVQAVKCTDFQLPCDSDQYCIQTSLTEIVCVGCSETCDGCIGSGPDNCIRCATGYTKELGGQCRACDVGKFGSNCTGECHCLNQELCRKETGYCEGFRCARGYRTAPLCKDTCIPNTYGVDCAQECHCPLNDTCNTINGLCSSGQCNIDYGGPSCSVRKPKLVSPPELMLLIQSCSVRISWNAWDKENDIGENTLGMYSVYYQRPANSTQWLKYRDIFVRTNQAIYAVDFNPPAEGEFYKFRVDAHQRSDDKIQPAAPGFATDAFYVDCSENPSTTPTIPTTTRSFIGTRIFNNITLQLISNDSVQVGWNLVDTVISLHFNVTVTYNVIGISDCAVLNEPNTTVQSVNKSTPVSLTGLKLYRRYLMTVEANGVNPVISDKLTKIIDTGEILPTGTVSNFLTKDLKSTSAEVIWSDVICSERGGILVKYDVLTNNLNNSVSRSDSVNKTSIILTGLLPYTTYSVQIRYVNSIGIGPYSSTFVFQTAESLPSPVTIIDFLPSETNITVTFNQPVEPNGVITEYNIAYSDNSEFTFPTSITHSAILGLSTTIQNVRAYTVYYVRIRAHNGAGSGNYGPIKTIRTLQDLPSPPVGPVLLFRNMTCIQVQWQPPTKPNGVIRSYTVLIKEVLDTGSDDNIASITTGLTVARKCNLLPGTLYRFVITATNDRGDSQQLTEDFWTEQNTPPVPPIPVLVESSFTSITVAIKPVILPPGPRISYQLQIEKVNARKRKRRVATLPGYVTAQLSQQDVPSDRTFVIGDGKIYGGYNNIPLEANQLYNIYYVLLSTLNNSTKTSFSKMSSPVSATPLQATEAPTTEEPPLTGGATDYTVLIIVLVVLFLIIIIIIIIILCVWWRRRRISVPYKPQLTNEIDMSVYMQDYDPETYWNKVFSFRESRYIIAGRDLLPTSPTDPAEMNGYTFCGPDNDRISFSKEFSNLPHTSKSATYNVANTRKNKNKNRFPHLLPYDQTRVVLKPDENSNSDYINASYIRDDNQEAAYIAAQSPFNEQTVIDFWRMIYQENIKTIVMITNTVEDDIVKCTQYWPETDDTRITVGSFYLELVEVDEYADYVIRTIYLQTSLGGDKYQVVLFDYSTWPEHGVPRDPIPFLEMRHKCREYHGKDRGPILVHCGTGMARTGVFIAVDSLIRQYTKEARISVFNFVKRMRKDRPHMVRTFGQYVFIYECIFEEFYAGDTMVGEDLKEIFHDLSKKNRKTGHSFLKDQFRLLEKFTFGPPSSKCSDALLPANRMKNRYCDVVPHDDDRPILVTPGGIGRNDYINAVFMDGYRKRGQFVVTQTPLHTTIIDFWKLVYDYDIKTIVMMENYDSKDDTCAKYWPDNKMKQFEPFIVEAYTVCQMENITSRDFKIFNLQKPNESPRIVRQFQLNDWHEPNFVPVSKTMILDLIDLVNDWQITSNQNTSPILVHCKDGATHSGIYTTLSVVCEKIENDNEVDVLHTIRHHKKQRVPIICQMEQYRFIYKALWDFINLRMEGGTLTDKMERTNEAFELESSPSFQSFSDIGIYS